MFKEYFSFLLKKLQFHSTALDTFLCQILLRILAQNYKIDLNFTQSFSSKYKNCITVSYFMGFHAIKRMCLRFFKNFEIDLLSWAAIKTDQLTFTIKD